MTSPLVEVDLALSRMIALASIASAGAHQYHAQCPPATPNLDYTVPRTASLGDALDIDSRAIPKDEPFNRSAVSGKHAAPSVALTVDPKLEAKGTLSISQPK